MHENIHKLKRELAHIDLNDPYFTTDKNFVKLFFTNLKRWVAEIPDEPDTLLKLFQVHYTNEDNDNLDLFVRATSPARAVEFWREYQRLNERDIPNDHMVTVYEVPEVEGKYGPVEWHLIKFRQVQNGEELR